jgi:MFS family permease
MVVMPLLPGLVRDVVGGDIAAAGLWLGVAISVSPLLTALTGPFWSRLAERFGHKAMIQRSLICIGVGIGLMAVAGSPHQVVLLRALIGALGGVSVAALAAVTASTPRRELGPAVGTLQAAQTAGAMVGPAVGGVLGGLVGLREAFVVSGGVFVAALGLVHLLYREPPAGEAIGSQSPRAGERAGHRALGLGMAVALVAAFVVQFVEGGLLVLLPLELERLGLSSDALPWVLGMGFSVVYLAATIASLFAGRLAARWSSVTMLAWVLVLGLVALVPLALATTWWQYLGLRVALALIVGAAPTLTYSAAATLAPPDRRGQMVSLMSSAGILGWAASPILAGALAQSHPSLLIGIGALLYAGMAGALVATERGWLTALPRAVFGLAGTGRRVGPVGGR